MSQQVISHGLDPERLRECTQKVLRDLAALERMIEEGRIETGIRRIGMEQELVLADDARRPAPRSIEMLEAIDDPHFTTELGRFNLEINFDPLVFGGDCLRRLETSVQAGVEKARRAGRRLGVDIVLTGILPTLRQTDLEMENITPVQRYFALNEGLKRLRGGEFDLRVSGIDEINVKHDSVMLEACNTSAQIHFQVAPHEFARLYNVAQVAAGPVLAAACNSPFLFGKRLWRETRMAVFEQSIDTRMPAHHVQDRAARVRFGDAWIEDSVVEIFRDDLARFRVFLGLDEYDEDPMDVLDAGGVPRLAALMLHNSTVYRWNRPCYGIANGTAHLRIENRILPAGPTIPDEIANAAFWFGLVSGLSARYDDIRGQFEFDTAKTNFFRAVRQGLESRLIWLDGCKHPADELIVNELLPIAADGLRRSGLDPEDIERYLGIIERRAATAQTGAEWMLRSYAGMHGEGTKFERLRALVGAMLTRVEEGGPVSDWTPARIEEAGRWHHNFQRVGQYMTTDLFTVHEDEVIDLIANVMAWRNIRHVPVEDDDEHLVGLVSYRTLLEFITKQQSEATTRPVAVKEIMQLDPLTVSPDTPTLEAIELMRRNGATCLPVVKNERLVGIVSEHDFMNIAVLLLRDHPEHLAPGGGGGE